MACLINRGRKTREHRAKADKPPLRATRWLRRARLEHSPRYEVQSGCCLALCACQTQLTTKRAGAHFRHVWFFECSAKYRQDAHVEGAFDQPQERQQRNQQRASYQHRASIEGAAAQQECNW